MPRFRISHFPRPLTRAILPVLAVLAVAGLVSSLAVARPMTKRVVKEVHSEALGRTVLAANNRHTLYSLSVEKHGKFICTGSCLATWIPLIVPAGVKPTGPVALGTVKRPNGKRQVSFNGRPLYTFASDTGPGEANGDGFKDVGTWRAVSP